MAFALPTARQPLCAAGVGRKLRLRLPSPPGYWELGLDQH